MTLPLTKDVLELADVCTRKNYHISNAVQSHYVLLVLEPDDLEIIYASSNTALAFRLPPSRLIGRPLTSLLEASSASSIIRLIYNQKLNTPEHRGRLPARLRLSDTHRQLDAVLYRSDSYICVEIEGTEFGKRQLDSIDVLFLRLADTINTYSETSAALSTLLCQAIQSMTGFDRVWYCEFDQDGNGYVPGECNRGQLPSLLSHRFPFTDIPVNIRPIYTLNKSRAIFDTEDTGAIVVDAAGEPLPPLDLTYSVARMPADTHIEYLRNMGVRASASFSVVDQHNLVGLFGAHHQYPLLLHYRQLAACQYLVDQYLTKFALLEQQEKIAAVAAKEQKIETLIATSTANRFDIVSMLETDHSTFNDLLRADGVICRYGGRLYGAKNLAAEDRDAVVALIDDRLKRTDLFHTQSLFAFDPRFLTFRDSLSGLLAIRLNDDLAIDSGHFIAWYRSEHAHKEYWAGNPAQAVLQDQSGRVGPRKSFESWLRIVEGNSLPWQPHEIAVALKFRNTFLLRRAGYLGQLGLDYAKRLDAVLNTVVDAIISIDLQGEIQAVNPSAERLYGYAAAELVGRHIGLLIPGLQFDTDGRLMLPRPAAPETSASETAAPETAGPVEGAGELVSRRRDGTVFQTEFTANIVTLENERFYVAVARDISDRKRFENDLRAAKDTAERANAYKTQFLANMSHELRTPLHTILGFVDAVIGKIDSMPKDRQLQYLGLVRASSNRLLHLISDLLDLTKLEAGMTRYSFSRHDLTEVIRGATAEIQRLAANRNLQLSLHAEPGFMTVFDRDKLYRVMINLLTNSSKFTPDGRSIDVSLTRDGDLITICVADEGIGIPDDELDSIFDKFAQSSKTNTNAGGTGLGLSICREIVQAHQGRIWAQNNTRGGASFLVELPANLPEQTVTI